MQPPGEGGGGEGADGAAHEDGLDAGAERGVQSVHRHLQGRHCNGGWSEERNYGSPPSHRHQQQN